MLMLISNLAALFLFFAIVLYNGDDSATGIHNASLWAFKASIALGSAAAVAEFLMVCRMFCGKIRDRLANGAAAAKASDMCFMLFVNVATGLSAIFLGTLGYHCFGRWGDFGFEKNTQLAFSVACIALSFLLSAFFRPRSMLLSIWKAEADDAKGEVARFEQVQDTANE
jgi:hypothetical protein